MGWRRTGAGLDEVLGFGGDLIERSLDRADHSGSPTFNLAGEVVGVNTAIFSPSGGTVGITAPGKTVSLTLFRQGQERTVTVEVRAEPKA